MKNSVYKTALGDELINSQNYNQAIIEYLEKERELISKIIGQFPFVVEAGCMHGRLVDLVVGQKRNYLGIDIEERYIQQANKNHIVSQTTRFVCNDIVNLPIILEDPDFEKKFIIVFPFNSFGNVEDGKGTLNVLLHHNFPVAIFTYGTDAPSNSAREEYYKNSGFKTVKKIINTDGVVFTDESGLRSTAFEEAWFRGEFKDYYKSFGKTRFSEIGVAYYYNLD